MNGVPQQHPAADVAAPPPGDGVRAPFDRDEANRILDEYEDSSDFDLAEAERLAAHYEAAAAASGETELLWRARLLRADMLECRGEPAESVRILSDALDWAKVHDCRRVQVRAHHVLARLYHLMGDLAATLDHTLQCVSALDDTIPIANRIGCLIKLADAFAMTGSVPAARERYDQAERLAAEHGIVTRQMAALNNWAYTEYEAGDGAGAREVLARLRQVAHAHGEPLNSNVLDTVARVEMLCGDLPAALRAAHDAIAVFRRENRVREVDAETDLLLTLALVQRRSGDLEAALGTVTEVQRRCERLPLVTNAAQALSELAEIHAAGGDFERAYRAVREFNAAQEQLSSAQHEIQARNRRVMFEVAEARRQAEWFREQAHRDALTGLHNRRYVDEHLPPLLRRAAADGSRVTIALLDLDHFKRVNDTLSHEAGDQVLTTVAGLLDTVETGPDGFTARLGGEEFLVVVRGTDADGALARLEALRRTIAAYPWQPITGDLPVTTSIGVAAATADSTQSSLLGEADAALYTAKRAGRDRISVAPATIEPKRRRWRDAPRLAS
ncbi:diguanylate cyclase (GGDEF)-like protein [Krasilnikovia cinnamomea]|uniref:Diguanylate cyclase (GGDEF)-like protein n=1 Tax=Krasilnikovia cinnamomea TaxID=349313 RepID=A0A4Q7ZPX5_9ACTN|nr:GGDEF domain-containing protein [Krasilnikovia cinnamomea]RZU52593.1 diguanylate cyclase (GGDEF)-like protein [Krasilnikovia cinnamomea]